MKPRKKRRKLRLKTPRTVALLVRMEPSALQALREVARDLDLSMSNLLSRAAAEYLERRVLAARSPSPGGSGA